MVNDILLQEVELGQFEVDEMWTFIKKKIEQGSPNSDVEGDSWIFNFIQKGSYLMVAYNVGKQGLRTCKNLFEKIFSRVELPFPDNKIQIFSDGNDDYKTTIPEYYAETCVDYGQVIIIRECGKVVEKIKIIVYGSPSIDEIETIDIENMNSIFRDRIGRSVRKTKCHSKKKPKLVNAIELFQFYWNFMDRLPKRGTSAMIENLTNYQWSWEYFFYFPLSILN